ncbi:MAG: peptidase dimerization domain-containing protein, partial [Steroidobacteraceae bacterium]
MDPKHAARERFDSARDGLIELSHRIHAHPELGFEEEKSSGWLCESLADAGFDVADEVGLTVTVIGTPAEEVGNASGKILLLERGGFEGVHAAMMIHPAPVDELKAQIIAASMFDVHCTGKESHASAFPELGINAADALTLAQTAIGLLRQHIRSTDRIHGIVTEGGVAPNVVPAHTSARYIVRSATLE